MLTKTYYTNGTNEFKNHEFDSHDWSAPCMVSYQEIQERMDSFHLIGRTIKNLKVIGHSFMHTRDWIESIAYTMLENEGLSGEELKKASDYKNIDKQMLFQRYMHIDEPLLMEFEDGDQFEIVTENEPEYRMSMNVIPWKIAPGVCNANADAAIIFSPCIGEMIERIEYETEIVSTEDDEALEIIDDLIIWLSNGMGLSISIVWHDTCCVELIDANKELGKMKFSELKTALFNFEDFEEKAGAFLNKREDVPRAVSIRPLAPVFTERFAVLVYYENGETKKYVLPIAEDDENEEVIMYKRVPLTDEIWSSAQLDEYQNGIPYIQLKSGFCISTAKCYQRGTTYSEPVKQEKIIYENEKFAIKTQWNWDVESLYGDKELGALIAHERKDKVNDMDISTLVSISGERATTLDFAYMESAWGDGLVKIGVVNKGYGLMNASGKFILPPIYDSIEDVADGWVKVHKGNRGFCVNRDGKTASNNKYVYAGIYSDGLCAVSTMIVPMVEPQIAFDDGEIEGVWGYVNEEGEEVIPPQYIYAYPFSKGIALVCKGEWIKDPRCKDNTDRYYSKEHLWGGINKAGETVISFLFEDIIEMDVDEGEPPVFKASYDGYWGVIDANGNWLADPVFEKISYDFHNGMFGFEKGMSYYSTGIYDTKTQKVIFEPQFREFFFMDNGYLDVCVFDKELGYEVEKIIDMNGTEKFHSEYTLINTAMSESYWIATVKTDVERRYGIIDSQGNVVVPCRYEDISFSKYNVVLFAKKKFIFQQGKKKGICRFDGTVEIQPIYDEISDCNHDMYIIWGESADGSYGCGLITDTGDEVLPTIYNRLSWFSEDILILSDENGCTVAQYIEKK